MSKSILYLTFYFEPDLSAGSFRNTSLLKKLAEKGKGEVDITVITTKPNRYNSFQEDALSYEEHKNYKIFRVQLPKHNSGMFDQIIAFYSYFKEVKKLASKRDFDLIYCSSSRLFTGYLGYLIAKNKKIPMYIDVRDIFVDTMSDVLKNKVVKFILLPFLRIVEKKVFSSATHINLISKGFSSYFKGYQKANFTFFSNGIDSFFLDNKNTCKLINEKKVITYAGNIGQGQGLHKIIPQAAKLLGENYVFQVIGDGGAKELLIEEISSQGISNVILKSPVRREELISIYNNSDFLFIHLNDYEAFKKVLPSKVFELGTFDKPIIAGVGGFAFEFMKENLDNVILFTPCDVDSFVTQLKSYDYRLEERVEFKNKFGRDKVNSDMADSILQYLQAEKISFM